MVSSKISVVVHSFLPSSRGNGCESEMASATASDCANASAADCTAATSDEDYENGFSSGCDRRR